MVGDDIEITVVAIRGDKVRLGITAPKEIGVHRKEVYDAIKRENRAAAQVKPEDLTGFGAAPKCPAGHVMTPINGGAAGWTCQHGCATYPPNDQPTPRDPSKRSKRSKYAADPDGFRGPAVVPA